MVKNHFVNTISCKPLVGILQNLQLWCFSAVGDEDELLTF